MSCTCLARVHNLSWCCLAVAWSVSVIHQEERDLGRCERMGRTHGKATALPGCVPACPACIIGNNIFMLELWCMTHSSMSMVAGWAWCVADMRRSPMLTDGMGSDGLLHGRHGLLQGRHAHLDYVVTHCMTAP